MVVFWLLRSAFAISCTVASFLFLSLGEKWIQECKEEPASCHFKYFLICQLEKSHFKEVKEKTFAKWAYWKGHTQNKYIWLICVLKDFCYMKTEAAWFSTSICFLKQNKEILTIVNVTGWVEGRQVSKVSWHQYSPGWLFEGGGCKFPDAANQQWLQYGATERITEHIMALIFTIKIKWHFSWTPPTYWRAVSSILKDQIQSSAQRWYILLS